MKNRIDTLLAGRQPDLALLRHLDDAVIQAIDKHARRDGDHQAVAVTYLMVLDETYGAFHESPAMQKAYAQLAGASPTAFWNEGWPKFKNYRAKAWTKLIA